MEIKRTFEKGRMNSDIDTSQLPAGEHIESENINFDSGVAVPFKGELLLYKSNYTNCKVKGKLEVPSSNKIYYIYKADGVEGVDEFDINTLVNKSLLKSVTGKLGLNNKVTGINLIGDFLFWVQKGNPPRRLDITKVYTTDGFEEKDIAVIKPAPINPPSLVLSNNYTGEDNIRDRFLSFSYRYKFITGEYSAFSPFSKIAFLPKNFDFDFATHTNEGMINRYNTVEIFYNTGDSLVKEVQLLFKESGANTVYLIDKFDKVKLSYGDNVLKSHVFNNNKIHKVLPTDQLTRLFDNVPREVESQEVIGNRILYGNYLEGRNIDTDVNHTVNYIAAATPTTSAPKDSLKSNRDLEVQMVYLDEESRMTTPLSSKNNTVYIKPTDADKANSLVITIPKEQLAPSFAKYFRFFIKQNKFEYETILPTLFYEDGVYRWIKYEESEKDKITVGKYLIVKKDTGGPVNRPVEVKILESGYKEGNFLRPELTGIAETDEELRKIIQPAGYYFKIKPAGFVMDYKDLEILEDTSYHNTRDAYDNPMRGETISISHPVLYGDSLIGVTSSGTYTPPANGSFNSYDVLGNQKDLRFKITIDAGGTTFSWSTNSTTLIVPLSGNSVGPIPIGGGIFPLALGVSVVFPDRASGIYPYTPTEYFVVSAKSVMDDRVNRALACLKGFTNQDNTLNEIVEGGAQLTFWVKEYGGTAKTTILDSYYSKTSSKQYSNLEEWWHEDGIIFTQIDKKSFFFRRGYKVPDGNSYIFTENNTNVAGVYQYPMHIFIRGQVAGASGDNRRGKISSSIKINQSAGDNFMLFETRPEEIADDKIFYEIGDTYAIDGNKYHLGNTGINASDINQTGLVDAKINLRFSNCYSYGNHVESYKIKDAFLGNKMKVDARVMSPIEDYKEVWNHTDLTYSEGYSRSTNINRLNEFNLSNLNFKELSSTQEGPIRRLATRKGDVLVFQDRMVSKVLFGRTILSNVDGTQNLVATKDVLGAQDFYSNKYGIGDLAESYSEFGNSFFFADPYNGTIMRGSVSGLDEIVYGRKDFFKKILNNNISVHGVYDLLNDSYIVNINNVLHYYKEDAKGWTTTNPLANDVMASLNNRVFTFNGGRIYEMYKGGLKSGKIKTVFNEYPHDTKSFEAIRLESINPLNVSISSHVGASVVYDYEKREDFYHGYIPKSTISSSNKYGLGTVSAVAGTLITLNGNVNYSASVGDTLESATNVLGVISEIGSNFVRVTTLLSSVVAGDFLLGSKNTTIEGDSIRGTIAEVTIDFDNLSEHKLVAINVHADKSFN